MEAEYVTMPLGDLRKVQLIELEMLLEVDRICSKNDIKYYMVGGTLLGSVRHQGYIPWDDDADIAMLRSEYEKFCKACALDLKKEKFYFQDHVNTQEYRWGYGKLRRKGTEFIRAGQEHLEYDSGIFIDIFPVDYVPENKFFRTIQTIACFVVRKLLWSAVGSKYEKKWYLQYFYKFLALIPKKIDFLFYNLIKEISNIKRSKYVRTLTFPLPKSCPHPALTEWVENVHPMDFEHYKLLGPDGYEEYLQFKFGDYMKLPSMEQRCGHAFSSYKLVNELEIMDDPKKG